MLSMSMQHTKIIADYKQSYLYNKHVYFDYLLIYSIMNHTHTQQTSKVYAAYPLARPASSSRPTTNLLRMRYSTSRWFWIGSTIERLHHVHATIHRLAPIICCFANLYAFETTDIVM